MVRRMTSWSALSSSSMIWISSVSARGLVPFVWLSSCVTVSGSSLVSIRLRASAYLVVRPLEISDGHVVAGQGGNPPVA